MSEILELARKIAAAEECFEPEAQEAIAELVRDLEPDDRTDAIDAVERIVGGEYGGEEIANELREPYEEVGNGLYLDGEGETDTTWTDANRDYNASRGV